MCSSPCERSELSKPEMILSPLLTQRSKLTRLEMQMFPARAILMSNTFIVFVPKYPERILT